MFTVGSGLDLHAAGNLTRMRNLAGTTTMTPTSDAQRPTTARRVRHIGLVLTLAALAACAQMPNAPTQEDIEKGMNTPSTPSPSLGGLVSDAQSGAPVVGAVITVQGRTSTTGLSGTFGFDANLTAGVFAVKVSHEQYVEVVRDVEIQPYKWENFRLERR